MRFFKGKIKEENKTEITGSEKMKLFPDNIGMLVNDFLMEHFSEILDYNFTASVEKEFDEIAEGKTEWTGMISKFYESFHGRVEYVLENAGFYKPERLLGDDPATGLPVYVRMARFGAVAQIGETSGEKKPKYARLRKGQHLESITLDEALNLFKLPRLLGKYEDKDVSASVGRFGPYVVHDSKFYSLPKDNNDPYTIDLNSAIEIIEIKREKDKNRVIRKFEEDSELAVLNGRWGPYISYKKMNYKIPRGVNAGELDYTECKKIIESAPAAKKKTRK